MSRIHRMFFVLLLLAAAHPAAAQGTIAVGQTVGGELSARDATDAEGRHYDTWRFTARAGMAYTVTLESDEFDAFLRVGPGDGADCDPCESDDDGGDFMDALVFLPAEAGGTHVIHATSFDARARGRYTLRLEAEPYEPETPSADTVLWTGTTTTADTVLWTGTTTTADTVLWTGITTVDTVLWTSVDTGAVLEAGPAEPRVLHPREGNGGTLAPVRRAQGGGYYDVWTYFAGAGETVRLSMESDEFDTVLRVGQMVDGAWRELAWDDDGGEGTNSLLTLTFPEAGVYLVHAAGYDDDDLGTYTLKAASDQVPFTPLGTSAPGFGTDSAAAVPMLDTVVPATPIARGETARGTLRVGDPMAMGGSYLDVWSYRGRAGEALTLTLRSGDFDALLRLGRNQDGQWEEIQTDDDGAGGTDSRITVTLPESGEYLIQVQSLFSGEEGEYVLLVDRE